MNYNIKYVFNNNEEPCAVGTYPKAIGSISIARPA
jgi:hypothetical protein